MKEGQVVCYIDQLGGEMPIKARGFFFCSYVPFSSISHALAHFIATKVQFAVSDGESLFNHRLMYLGRSSKSFWRMEVSYF